MDPGQPGVFCEGEGPQRVARPTLVGMRNEVWILRFIPELLGINT